MSTVVVEKRPRDWAALMCTHITRPSTLMTAGGTVALTWSRTFDWDTDDWRDKASCRNVDPDLFFPVGTTGSALDQIEQAKAVCRACEAQSACLEFALATNQESGVWGGTAEEERRKLRKQWVTRQRRGPLTA